jgi:hypothetical protein
MGRSTFKVPTVRQNTTAHPVLAMAKTYRKYNAEAPYDVKMAAAGQAGSVAANSNEGDVSYLSPVNVGGKTLNLDFDTGSSDLYVSGPSECKNQANSFPDGSSPPTFLPRSSPVTTSTRPARPPRD